MMPPGWRSSLARGFSGTGDAAWSSFLISFATGPAHAVAGKFDPMSALNEAVQHRVGVGGIAEHAMMPPFPKGWR
jgi:hypothetical protein